MEKHHEKKYIPIKAILILTIKTTNKYNSILIVIELNGSIVLVFKSQ